MESPQNLKMGMCARSPGYSANTLRGTYFTRLRVDGRGGRDLGVGKEGVGVRGSGAGAFRGSNASGGHIVLLHRCVLGAWCSRASQKAPDLFTEWPFL